MGGGVLVFGANGNGNGNGGVNGAERREKQVALALGPFSYTSSLSSEIGRAHV